MLRLIRNLIIIIALFVGVVFGFLNYASTSVDLLWTSVDAPLVLLLAIAFVIGLVLALIVCGLRIAKLRTRLSSTRRKLKDAEAKLSNFRSVPVQDA
ncbi:MAG: LapA family protein [Salinisphaera sp.]|jgi:putative membrane protein|nr:LapA family protein [Salinisphaera sp.]